MIIEHQSIELYGLPLFTRIDAETPVQSQLPIPSASCFTYFLSGNDQLLSKQHGVSASTDHAVLSVCGMTLGRILMEQETGHLSTIIVHFHPEVLKEVYKGSKPQQWKEIETPVTRVVVEMAATNLIKLYVEGLKGLFENTEAATDDILILKLKEIILLLMRTDSYPQISHMMRSMFSERTFSFKETIEAYLYTPATVENLATLTNTSVSTFKREFAKIYNAPPGRYIINRRVEKVAELLRVSDDPISSIGYDCGFSTPAHLTRVFKTKYNKTPSQYRLVYSDN